MGDLEQGIGRRIAWLRGERQLTQAQLGARMPRPWERQAVHAAEKGQRAFTAAELVALADILDANVADLLGPGASRTAESDRLRAAEEELAATLARAAELAALIRNLRKD